MSLSFREQLSSAVETLPKYRVAVYIDGFKPSNGDRPESLTPAGTDTCGLTHTR
jgi:hypothetical protein